MTDTFTIDTDYPRPALGTDISPVVNRSHLSPDVGGMLLTVSTSERNTGDLIHLYWDGERVDTAEVSWYNYWIDFAVPPPVLQRHPGIIEVYYVVQTVGEPDARHARRSPSLTLDAKFTRPGGESPSPTDTPHVNDNLRPVEGTGGLTKGQDLALSIPAWENMEAGARPSVYWGNEVIAIDPATVVPGSPVKAIVPWAVIAASPQGIVSVSYDIRDRVGNTSGKAPAVDVDAVFDTLLPMPTFAGVNARGQLDLSRAAAGDHDSQASLVRVEVAYPDVVEGDDITLTLTGTTSNGLVLNPYRETTFAGGRLSDDPRADGLSTDDGAVMTRYTFGIPRAWLGYLVGGTVFAGYVVKRGTSIRESATRTRPVIGEAIVPPAPEVSQLVDGVLDLAMATGDIEVHMPVWSALPAELVATLRMRSDESPQGIELSMSVRQANDQDRLVWMLPRRRLEELRAKTWQLTVAFADANKATLLSGVTSLSLRQAPVEMAWPDLALPQASADNELAAATLNGASVKVVLAPNGLFRNGDEVSLEWAGRHSGSYTVQAEPPQAVVFEVPLEEVTRDSGTTISVVYRVKRQGKVVGPLPVKALAVRIAADTIGDLPPPHTDALDGDALDVTRAADGITLTSPSTADIRPGDEVRFQCRVPGSTWNDVPASTAIGHAGASVSADQLVPALGGVLEARYVVTRAGLSRTSDTLSAPLRGYSPNDSRLPKPLVEEATDRPGGKGNPFLDMNRPLPDFLTVRIPRWPFMRAGQRLTVSVRGFLDSSLIADTIVLVDAMVVTASHREKGVAVRLPTSWLLRQPRVAATDIEIVVSIERPLAAAGLRYMTLPVAVVDVLNLNEIRKPGNGTGPGTGGKPGAGSGSSFPPADDRPSLAVDEARTYAGNATPYLDIARLQNDATLLLRPWKGMAVGDVIYVVVAATRMTDVSATAAATATVIDKYALTARDLGATLRFPLSRSWLLDVVERQGFPLQLDFEGLCNRKKEFFETVVLARHGAGGSGEGAAPGKAGAGGSGSAGGHSAGGSGSTGATGTGGSGNSGNTVEGNTDDSGHGSGGNASAGSGLIDLVHYHWSGFLGVPENRLFTYSRPGPTGYPLKQATIEGTPVYRASYVRRLLLEFDIMTVPGKRYKIVSVTRSIQPGVDIEATGATELRSRYVAGRFQYTGFTATSSSVTLSVFSRKASYPTSHLLELVGFSISRDDETIDRESIAPPPIKG